MSDKTGLDAPMDRNGALCLLNCAKNKKIVD